jgi:hypothetical protein
VNASRPPEELLRRGEFVNELLKILLGDRLALLLVTSSSTSGSEPN